jgi:hypothetical protein
VLLIVLLFVRVAAGAGSCGAEDDAAAAVWTPDGPALPRPAFGSAVIIGGI